VGSQAIQVLWLKRDRMHEMRRAEAKLGILREVIERVKAGEDVDVEKVLGTGVESEEMEWAEGEFDSNPIKQRGDLLMKRSNEGDSQ
jgi:hypothetical protein